MSVRLLLFIDGWHIALVPFFEYYVVGWEFRIGM